MRIFIAKWQDGKVYLLLNGAKFLYRGILRRIIQKFHGTDGLGQLNLQKLFHK